MDIPYLIYQLYRIYWYSTVRRHAGDRLQGRQGDRPIVPGRNGALEELSWRVPVGKWLVTFSNWGTLRLYMLYYKHKENLNPLNPLVFLKRETPSINNVDRWSQLLSCENVTVNGDSGENKPYWQVKTSILPVLSEPLHVTKSEGPNVCGTKTSPPGRAKRWPERVEPPGQEQWSENVDSTCQKRGISPGSGIQLRHQQQKWWFHIFHEQKMGI